MSIEASQSESHSRAAMPFETLSVLIAGASIGRPPAEDLHLNCHCIPGTAISRYNADEGDAKRSRRVDARRQILRPWQVSHQLFGFIGPHKLFRDADVVAQNAGALRDR